MPLFQELTWRELLHSATPGAEEVLEKESITAYIGFDPTAASLHVGSFLQIMSLARLQRFGHTPIAIVGGGTGLIGDPSGKSAERQLLSKEKLEENLQGIRKQLELFLDFDAKKNPARIINNADWLVPLNMMDFLRDIGKYFTVNMMLQKESVKKRVDSEDGMSFTEFSYMLLQAYDFLWLYDKYNCTFQFGGSDQWGNITAGADLIRRLRGGKAHGVVVPLVSNSSGTKFGKTESGTVWLDAGLTSPYKFYQFWFNTSDLDVIKYLKYFTWLTQSYVQELEEATKSSPEKREAQRSLASELTSTVHGQSGLAAAERASSILFGATMDGLKAAEISEVFSDVPSGILNVNEITGKPVSDLLVSSGLVTSSSDARRLIQAGGIYINNRRVDDIKYTISSSDLLDDSILVLRKGQKQFYVFRKV